VAEVVLHRPQVRAAVGEVVPARVPKRVWMHVRQACVPRGCGGQVVDRLVRQLRVALGEEEPDLAARVAPSISCCPTSSVPPWCSAVRRAR
jgi:hypothetical protein